MSTVKLLFTPPALCKRYGAPYYRVKLIIRRLNLGIPAGRQRLIEPHELEAFELGLRVLGFSIPENLPSIQELEQEIRGAEEAQAQEVAS
jgi:hypothetical protein